MSELRVTQAGIEVLTTGDKLRATGVAVEVIYPGAFAPHAPDLSIAFLGSTSVALETGDFLGAEAGDEHASTQWQVTTAADTGFADPVWNVISEADLIFRLLEELDEETAYIARARHTGTLGGDSPWSEVVEFTTTPSVIRPDTPAVILLDKGEDFFQVEGSEFSHPDGAVPPHEYDLEDPNPYHLASQWEVRIQGTSWDDAIYAEDPEPFTGDRTFGLSDLTAATTYEVRVRYQDGDSGEFSLWSAALEITTDAAPEVRPDTPTLASVSCGELITVTASAFAAGDGSSATHQASQWRVCHASRNEAGEFIEDTGGCAVFTSGTDLTSFTFPPFLADYGNHRRVFSVRFQDSDDAWSEWSTIVYSDPALRCDESPKPLNPEILSPIGGQPFATDFPLTWKQWESYVAQEYEEVNDPEWLFRVEISADFGATWDAVADDVPLGPKQEDYWWRQEITVPISDRPNGLYIIRVQTRGPSGPRVSDWSYVAVNIDRTEERIRHVDMAAIANNTLPATWERRWFDAEALEWVFVRDEADFPHAGPEDAAIGLLGRWGDIDNFGAQISAGGSVLAFTEHGEPITGAFVTQWENAPNERAWFPWRWSNTGLNNGGLAYRITGSGGEGDPLRGVDVRIRTAAEPFSLDPAKVQGACFPPEAPKPWAPCRFYSCRQAERALPDSAQVQRGFPTGTVRYGVSRLNSRHRAMVRADTGTISPSLVTTSPLAAIPPEGTRTRGHQHPRNGYTRLGGCRPHHEWITHVLIVERVEGEYLLRSKAFGPGLDPTGGWDWEATFSGIDQGIPCGPCGLHLFHTPHLSNQRGVLFRSFAADVPDDLIFSGPLYGTPTVEATP